MKLDASRTLREIGVPDGIIRQFPRLPRDAEGLLIYGSRARGDSVEGSDLDVLALVPSSRPSKSVGDVSVSFYTRAQLATGIGTLFGAHLRRDAKILWDPSSVLTDHIAAMGTVDVERLLYRVKLMSSLFTSPQHDLPKYMDGLIRQARYLLRSALYAQAIRDGEPCFSVREIADRNQDPHLANLLASRRTSDASLTDLEECIERLRDLIGDFPPSVHGSLEATVVNEWGKSGDILSAAFLILGSSGKGSVYAEVEKILL